MTKFGFFWTVWTGSAVTRFLKSKTEPNHNCKKNCNTLRHRIPGTRAALPLHQIMPSEGVPLPFLPGRKDSFIDFFEIGMLPYN